jgi:hypothetical protein
MDISTAPIVTASIVTAPIVMATPPPLAGSAVAYPVTDGTIPT